MAGFEGRERDMTIVCVGGTPTIAKAACRSGRYDKPS